MSSSLCGDSSVGQLPHDVLTKLVIIMIWVGDADQPHVQRRQSFVAVCLSLSHAHKAIDDRCITDETFDKAHPGAPSRSYTNMVALKYPRGSKYPILKDPGPKKHTLHGIVFGTRVLKYWVLGPFGYLLGACSGAFAA